MTLDKIRNLVARAAHPSTPVEEARTSAVIACRMIVDNDVDLRLPGAPQQAPEIFKWIDFLSVIFGEAARARAGTPASAPARAAARERSWATPDPGPFMAWTRQQRENFKRQQEARASRATRRKAKRRGKKR